MGFLFTCWNSHSISIRSKVHVCSVPLHFHA
ncbi:hypothetical protein Nmel_008145 [Mimus melanotis]